MNFQRYKIEILLASSLLFMVLALGYKSISSASLNSSKEEFATTKQEIGQIVALQELWGDKKITKKVKALETLLPKDKVHTFSVKSKRLNASFKALQINDLNRLSNKITGLAIEIDRFNLSNDGKAYRLELKCKW